MKLHLCMWLCIHRGNKLTQSFQVDVARHAQSDWKQEFSYILKMNLGMMLVFCMWLSIHKYIYLIQSIHVSQTWQWKVCNRMCASQHEMEHCANIVNSFLVLTISQNTPFYVFDRVLNTPLASIYKQLLCCSFHSKFCLYHCFIYFALLTVNILCKIH